MRIIVKCPFFFFINTFMFQTYQLFALVYQRAYCMVSEIKVLFCETKLFRNINKNRQTEFIVSIEVITK